METTAQVIALVGVLVFLAHLFTAIFSRTRIPDVILLILIGIAFGPVLGLATPDLFGAVGPVFTTVTLIIILFESGIALRLNMLRSALGGAMVLAPLSFFSTMVVVAGIAVWLTDLTILPAFILGAIVGSTSEAVVIPLVRQLKIKEETSTLLSVESSVNDVLSIVITVSLVQAYAVGSFNIGSVSGKLIASFLVAGVLGVLGALVWSVLLNKIHAIKNAMFTTPAFVFILYGIVENMEFSGAIAALAFGVTIGNIEAIRFPIFKTMTTREPVGLSETEKVFFSEVAFLLKTFFFIYLGLSLELISTELIILALILTGIAFVLRIPAVRFSLKKPMDTKSMAIMAIMVPKGLAAVVLASLPLQYGIAGGEIIQKTTYGIVLFSIVLTAFLVILMEKTPLSRFYGWMITPSSLRVKALSRLRGIAGQTDTLRPAGDKLFGGSDDKEKPSGKDDI